MTDLPLRQNQLSEALACIQHLEEPVANGKSAPAWQNFQPKGFACMVGTVVARPLQM
jgi:hypothetical protein